MIDLNDLLRISQLTLNFLHFQYLIDILVILFHGMNSKLFVKSSPNVMNLVTQLILIVFLIEMSKVQIPLFYCNY